MSIPIIKFREASQENIVEMLRRLSVDTSVPMELLSARSARTMSKESTESKETFGASSSCKDTPRSGESPRGGVGGRPAMARTRVGHAAGVPVGGVPANCTIEDGQSVVCPIIASMTHTSKNVSIMQSIWTAWCVCSGQRAPSEPKTGITILRASRLPDVERKRKGSRAFARRNTVGETETPARASLRQSVQGLPALRLNHGQTGAVYTLASEGESVAIFKPLEGEKFNRRGLQPGQGSIREEAVYLVDRLCDSEAGVPVTSLASIDMDDKTLHGSVQAFVTGVVGFADDFGMPRDVEAAREVVAQDTVEGLALLDLRTFNTDRHGGNLLFLGTGKPHQLGPIDHGCCLPPWYSLSEACFDAWLSWPHLRAEPSESGRALALKASERLPETCAALRDLGLEEASITTLRICTLFVKVGVAELGLPIERLAMLMLRDEDDGFARISWLEAKVLACAQAAGVAVSLGRNERGGDEVVFAEGTREADSPEAPLFGLEEAMRGELENATVEVQSARLSIFDA